MQINQFQKILQTIDSHGENGCSKQVLVKESGLEPTDINTFVYKYRKLLTHNNKKYAINKSGKHKGNIEAITTSQRRKNLAVKIIVVLISALSVYALGLITQG